MKILIKFSVCFIYFLLNINSIFFSAKVHAEIPADIKRIMNRGKLIIAINSVDYPPFFYTTKDKKFEGYDVEIAQDIAKYLGVSVEFNRSASTFKDVVKLVENDKADIAISAISATLSRGLTVRFSEPYLSPNQCLIVNRLFEIKISNKDKIESSHLKVAILNHSSYEDFAKQNDEYFGSIYKNLEIIKYDSLDQALSDAMEGKIIGLYTDEIYANYVIKNKQSAHIFVRKKIVPDTIDPISIAVNWNSPNLAYWINLYIKKMKNNGKEKYLTSKFLRDKND